MAMPKSKRKTRSDKYPLTLHKTGQFCKKIKGKLYYFGNDKQKALQHYLEQASQLHSGKEASRTSTRSDITLKTLCNLYLEYQDAGVQVGQITASHYKDQVGSLRLLARFLGQHSLVDEISTLDLQNYKRKLMRSYGSGHRVNLNISIMKAMFHWAKKNEVVDRIPNIDSVSKIKVVEAEKFIFTRAHIEKLVRVAGTKMCAMIWLAINCGFGCTDCAELKWKNLDLKSKRVKLARTKTGISRNLPLWPETVSALKEVEKKGDLVFYTSRGNPWVRTIKGADKDGNVKYCNDNAVTKEFAKLIRKTGIEVPKRAGFYSLRRTAATLTAASGDPFAVQKLLGHADLKMATTYVQNISEQTDRAINNARSFIVQDDS
ncbi:tyrosine-type recombinase/integrase [Planctomycetota bacterium]